MRIVSRALRRKSSIRRNGFRSGFCTRSCGFDAFDFSVAGVIRRIRLTALIEGACIPSGPKSDTRLGKLHLNKRTCFLVLDKWLGSTSAELA